MTLEDVRKLRENARYAMTLMVQGIEQMARAAEVHGARGGQTAITDLKYTTPSTPEEIAFNAEIDAIVAEFTEIGTINVKVQANLFTGADRATMMKLRTDI